MARPTTRTALAARIALRPRTRPRELTAPESGGDMGAIVLLPNGAPNRSRTCLNPRDRCLTHDQDPVRTNLNRVRPFRSVAGPSESDRASADLNAGDHVCLATATNPAKTSSAEMTNCTATRSGGGLGLRRNSRGGTRLARAYIQA